MLTYTEANLFVRAGDDMRFLDWPEGDFIRLIPTNYIPPEGYSITTYVPTIVEQTQTKWRRA